MQIKDKGAHKSLWKAPLRAAAIFKGNTMLRSAAVFAITAAIAVFFIAVAVRTGFAARVGRIISSRSYLIPFNYLKGLSAIPERIDIHIKDMDMKAIAYDRYLALNKGYLLPDFRHEVPALIRYKDKMHKAKLRLKGNMPDHWSGDRWSFRINLKEGAILGMKQFSIQHPGTRDGLAEWYYKKLLEDKGLICQRYDFIDVGINGKRMGIYAIEEHFGNVLLAHNLRRDGPILYFNDNYLWESVVKAGENNFNDYSQEAYWAAEIEGYLPKDPEEHKDFMKNFAMARNRLELFRSGKIAASNIFDIKRTAKLFAVSELCGSLHSHEYPNVKFYYNPITGLLEPVGSDVGSIGTIDHLAGSAEKDEREDFFSTWERRLFEDKIFMKEYVRALEEISQDSYLDNFFKKNGHEADQKLKLLYKSYPWYSFTGKSILYKNQKFIRNALGPSKGLRAYAEEPIVKDSKLMLILGNIQTMPVEVLGVVYKKSILLSPAEETILAGKKRSSPADYRPVSFYIREGLSPSTISVADIAVKYRIPGSSSVRYETVSAWPYLPIGSAAPAEAGRPKSNLHDFNCLVVEEGSKEIIFKSGEWDIKKDLIIPEGYRAVAGEGVRLNLSNSASIISYSPVSFNGSEEEPVSIYSGDATGQGLLVLNANGASLLRYVNFDNLSNPVQDGFMASGAVTFYESPVKISDCTFSNNRGGDDYLNIIRTDFELVRTVIRNTAFDAFDGDFTNGKIEDVHFINCGNDAIDLSGSAVRIVDVYVDKAGDKGLSIGEESNVAAYHVEIKNANIAAASKDKSELKMKDVSVRDCNRGFAVYQKKDEFGPSSMRVEKAVMEQVNSPYLVQAGSALTVDGKEIAENADEIPI